MSAFRVYIAAPFAARDGLLHFADELRAIGMECLSSWLTEPGDTQEGAGTARSLTDEEVRNAAWTDLRAVDKADAIVQFTGLAIEALSIPGACGPMLHTGGRHVELGYALARNKPVIVIGPMENVFQRALSTNVPDWHAAVLALVALERDIARDRVVSAEAVA